MDKSGIYSYNNYPIHKYGGNQGDFATDNDDDTVYELLQNNYIIYYSSQL